MTENIFYYSTQKLLGVKKNVLLSWLLMNLYTEDNETPVILTLMENFLLYFCSV